MKEKNNVAISSNDAEKFSESIVVSASSHHFYDNACQVLILIQYLFISLINYVCKTNFLPTEKITFLTRKFPDIVNKGFKNFEVDAIFQVGDKSKIYHFEFQTMEDKNMVKRFGVYNVKIRTNPDYIPLGIEQCLIQLKYRADDISYIFDEAIKHVVVLNVIDISLQEIIYNHLQILAPFYFLRYEEKDLKEKEYYGTIKVNIKRDFVELYNSIISLAKEWLITKDEVSLLRHCMLAVIKDITDDSAFIEELLSVADGIKITDITKHMTEDELKSFNTYLALKDAEQEVGYKNQEIGELNQKLEQQTQKVINERNKNKKLVAKTDKLTSELEAAYAEIARLKAQKTGNK